MRRSFGTGNIDHHLVHRFYILKFNNDIAKKIITNEIINIVKCLLLVNTVTIKINYLFIKKYSSN